MEIELATAPSKDDLKTISQGIQQFNQEHMPDEVVFEKDTRFTVFARNDRGEVVGGIRAKAFWNYCIIELLWLSEEARGTGIGSQLLHRAEAYARKKGFEYVRTETLDIQARPFYEKRGYRVYGELKDCPRGHTSYCLVKKL